MKRPNSTVQEMRTVNQTPGSISPPPATLPPSGSWSSSNVSGEVSTQVIETRLVNTVFIIVSYFGGSKRIYRELVLSKFRIHPSEDNKRITAGEGRHTHGVITVRDCEA